jgi:eukaryotic-like serine/threonine-protein kinase
MQAAERDRLALQLLYQAMDIDAADQAIWIAKATQDDIELRDRVMALLRVEKGLTDWDDAPVQQVPVLPPADIGPYRLDQMIGAGGMGSVYRAHRADGLFDQTVAIKFMAARQGMLDLGPLIDAERRSLARMDHDNIARILDGGQTAEGLHYLVMEHVDGQPISASTLTAPDRIGLIRQIAAALAHAHQAQIVHCDVKPGNILVTAEGRAKLIDFGIARLQDRGPAGGLDGMTRAYASPERCQMAPATLADDVYALAVTLFEVLTGALPWDNPARPNPQTAPKPADLTHLPGLHNPSDLTAILARALAPDAARRYRSIEAFDDDLARWQTKRPVSAAPQSMAYVTRRLAQRRPLSVAAGLGVFALVIAGLVVISALYLAANTARATADTRFGELRSLARFMIFDLNEQLEQVPGATPARLALSEQAQGYLDTLGATARDDQGLQREVATGLLRLAEVQGVPSRPNLGLATAALANLDRAVAMFDSLIAVDPDNMVLRADRGRGLYFLAITRGVYDQDPGQQKSLADRAEADILAALAPATGARRGDLQVLLLGVRLTQADALVSLGDQENALRLRVTEEGRIRDLDPTERSFMDWNYEAGRVAAQVGDSLYGLGQIDMSKAAYDRAVTQFQAGLADAPLNRKLLGGLHYAHYALSGVLADLVDAAGGLEQARASAEVAQKLLDWDPTDRLALQLYEVSQGQIALMLRATGQVDQAIALIDAQVRRYRSASDAAPEDAAALRQVAVPLRGRAEMILQSQGQIAGCAAYAQARAAWDALDMKFGLTEQDRNGDVATIAAVMQANACP